ncbi:Cytochrome P450 93A1 [Morus notabilis]|uniref:Cytochrome P450 93A1 n=1 Tax=Morus notabilis TaxID=981085 RepID=W9SIF0_9ROSA|nr:3,9-dihydroxypterocarpan 6A-monooxygenase [Morus notabilis]EXC30899.1 Cytochrome P450 93A1 [Morus notabilis]
MEDLEGYIILTLVICLVSTVLARAILAKARTKARLPPSPPSLPIIGHLHLVGSIPHQSFQKLSNKYGPLIHISLGYVPCVVVSSLEMANEFLKTNESSFLDRPQFINIMNLSYPSADFTFALYGPYWKFMKKISMTQLLGGQTMDQLLPIRHEELKGFMNLMLRKADRKEAIEVDVELAKLMNNVISRMTMSQKCSDDDNEAEEIRKLVRETTEIAGRFNLSEYIWFCKNFDFQGLEKRCKEIHDRFDAMMEKIIKEHQEARKEEKGRSEKVKDLLDILLDIQECENSEIKLKKDHIKAFIMDMFVAGTDTTAKAIEWALAELINHPNIMNKAREEIYNAVGKTRLVEESDIANLHYLQAIMKETLRLHPTGPMILRESSKKCTTSGYEIPERTRLFVNTWAIGRDPKYWEDPLEFKPERFLGEEGGGKTVLDVRGQHFQLLPFGSGKRLCPGTSLSMQVIQTTLASMIQCFEWKVDGRNGTTLDMEEAPGLTLQRAHPLVSVPVARLCPMPL